MRKKIALLLIIIALLLLPLGIFLGTEWGLRIAMQLTSSLSGGMVTVGEVEGRVVQKFAVKDLTISTTATDVRVGNSSVEWRPFSLFAGKLEVITWETSFVDVQVKSQDKKQGDESTSLLPVFLPIDIHLHNLSLQDFEIREAGAKEGFKVDTLKTSAEFEATELAVNSFTLEGPEVGLNFHGNVNLDDSPKLDLLGGWFLAGFGFHPSRGTFSLQGPVTQLGVNVTLNDPGEIEVTGVIRDLLEKPTWTADVNARNVNLETWIDHCPEIILEKVHGDMNGDFGHYRGDVVAEGHWGVADDLYLQGNIDGDAWGIIFNSLRIDRNDSSAVATNGSISWEKVFSWEADLDVDNFVLSMFFPDFEGGVSSTFHSVGDVTEDAELVASFALQRMEGKFGEYQWSATGNIGLTENDISSEDLIIKSDMVGGQARIQHVLFSWEDELSWETDLNLVHFDPGFLHPEATGKVSGQISNRFEWQGQAPVGTLTVKELSGQLRGADISGSGTFTVDGEGLSSPGLELMLGDSRLNLQGRVDAGVGLDIVFDSPDLSQLGAGLKGALLINSQVTGTKEAPAIQLAASGQDIVTGAFSIGGIEATLSTTVSPQGLLDGELKLIDTIIAGHPVSLLDLSVAGHMEDHAIQLLLNTELGMVKADAVGGYDKKWQGLLSGLELDLQNYGNWQQEKKAGLQLSRDQVHLEDLCVTNGSFADSGSACISIDGALGEELPWSVSGHFQDFALKPFGKMDLGLPPLNGQIDGSFSANGNKQAVTGAVTLFSIEEVDTLVSVAEDEFVSFQLRDAVLEANLLESQLQFDLFFKTSNDGYLDFAGSIDNFGLFNTPLSDNSISANLVLDRYDLNSLAALTGFGVEPTGWVSSTLRLAGSMAQPAVYGDLAIEQGGLELPYQGITLSDVSLSIDSKNGGGLVRASASSGGGSLSAEGLVTRTDQGVEASLQLKGEDFLLVNLPEYSFRINPDAKIQVSRNKAFIDGDIFVPSGLIAPEELKGAVKVSEDVIYLGEETIHEKKSYPVELNVNVELGDDVKVDGYGLKGRLGGRLNVKITPEEFITGKGELDFLGATFTFYGRSLDIERGRMLFTGGPIDNPGVDIRAQKTVTAETARDDGYTVGVDINGLVQDLQFHLFSDPYMEDTDILSQMVVGHSFATSSEEEGTLLQAAARTLGLQGSAKLMKGIGDLLLIDELHLEGSSKKEDVSLVVGKRITEDLYIGYDMNMYSQLGQFRVRYDLKRGFYVETRSSSESTGADLIYSFER